MEPENLPKTEPLPTSQPENLSPRPQKRLGRVLLVVLLCGGAGFALFHFGAQLGLPIPGRSAENKDENSKGGKPDAGKDNRPVPVLVAPVQQRDVPVMLEGLGNVAPLYAVTVKPQVDGRLDQVLFREGQTVKKGDPLAQIDPRPFAIQLRSAEAVLARDTAQWKNAKVNLGRYGQLTKEKLIPEQQLTDQKAQVEQFDAQMKLDQAAIDNAKLLLEYTKVVAPMDGVTGVRLVDPGNIVHAADALGLVSLTQIDPVAVLFTLPEDDLPQVQKGMLNGKLQVEAWSRDGTQKLGVGTLEVIDNQINQQTATARLKAVVPNPEHALWPNQFVKVRLQVSIRTGVLVVQASAVQHGPKGMFVYVVGADNTAATRTVEVETMIGAEAVLRAPNAGVGVQAGELVVVDGQSRLKPGAKVLAKPWNLPNAPQHLPNAPQHLPGAPTHTAASEAPHGKP